MDLKFYLNKFLKVDNIEQYTLGALLSLRDVYDRFIENSGGVDPDFPMVDFGSKGKKINGVNKAKLDADSGETSNNQFPDNISQDNERNGGSEEVLSLSR